MFIAYRIGDESSRLPLFTLILLLTALTVYISMNDISLIPYLNTDKIGSISESRAERVESLSRLLTENGGRNSENRLVSLFFSQHLMQFFVEIWMAFILMSFIEMKTGRIPFIFLYMIFALLLNLLSDTGLYQSTVPFPYLQGMDLMMAGYFYVNHYRERIKIAYFIAPMESLKGRFEARAVLFILPFYIALQMLFIFIALMGSILPIVSFGVLLKSVDASGIAAVVHNSLLYFPFPSLGMLINIIVCPLIGACVGLIYGRLMNTDSVARIFQVPDGARYSISRVHEKLFRELNSADAAAVLNAESALEREFSLKKEPEVFERLYDYYSKRGMQEKKIKMTVFFLGKLDGENNEKEIFETYIVMKNNDDGELVNDLKPSEKAKIIRVLYERHLFEEARAYLDVIRKRNERDENLAKLTEYLDFKKFDY